MAAGDHAGQGQPDHILLAQQSDADGVHHPLEGRGEVAGVFLVHGHAVFPSQYHCIDPTTPLQVTVTVVPGQPYQLMESWLSFAPYVWTNQPPLP